MEPFVPKEWMNCIHENTNQYTVLNVDSSSRTMQIDLYDLQASKTATLIDTKDHTGLPRIDSYTFDGRKK
jgi:dipeptidyl-peptidase-4